VGATPGRIHALWLWVSLWTVSSLP
jgi:hypothetical protein